LKSISRVRTAACLRCGHEWALRSVKPRVCPNCRTPYWDVPAKTANLNAVDAERLKADTDSKIGIFRERFLQQRNKKRIRDYNRLHIVPLKSGGFSGRLLKRIMPSVCEVCGRPPRNKRCLDYHHWDDDTPALGVWVCSSCHHMAEKVDRGLHTVYIDLKARIVRGELVDFYPDTRAYCTQCGYRWVSRKKTPLKCPECHSEQWNIQSAK